ncbi:MAG: hypothetical protein ABIR19_07395 [Ginsengibacter sp.]
MKLLICLLLVFNSIFCEAQSTTLVIAEVYGGGGEVGAVYKNDYIVLFNLSGAPISLDNFGIWYGASEEASNPLISLSGIIKANHWFLVKGKADGITGAGLPAADAEAAFDISSTKGIVALVQKDQVVTPICTSPAGSILDIIGYGQNISCVETSPAATHTMQSALSRKNFASDGNNNSTDFALFPPAPRNSLDIALPVTLHDFMVKSSANANLIHWQVNCLSTSVTFQVERSKNARDFSGIYNAIETQARCAAPFDFSDSNPSEGSNYYRLKITDADGNTSYSKVAVSENKESRTAILKIQPNIISTSATLGFNASEAGKMKIQITDIAGRLVSGESFNVDLGAQTKVLQLNSIAPGRYQATIFLNGQRISSAPFLKQ